MVNLDLNFKATEVPLYSIRYYFSAIAWALRLLPACLSVACGIFMITTAAYCSWWMMSNCWSLVLYINYMHLSQSLLALSCRQPPTIWFGDCVFFKHQLSCFNLFNWLVVHCSAFSVYIGETNGYTEKHAGSPDAQTRNWSWPRFWHTWSYIQPMVVLYATVSSTRIYPSWDIQISILYTNPLAPVHKWGKLISEET